jgi:hypothetical protein
MAVLFTLYSKILVYVLVFEFDDLHGGVGFVIPVKEYGYP